jgi:cell division protein FtsI/penicillin-binding protein 2
MAGILSSGANYPGLESALQRSDSQQFLDAWLCRKQLGAGKFSPDCDRPERTQAIAHAWGWNHHCEKKSSASVSPLCGQRDILTGLDMGLSMYAQPLLPVLSGHTLVTAPTTGDKKNSHAEMQWPKNMPSAEERLLCAESGKTGYTRCKGANLGLISEAYGQGNTLTTPVGMAGMLASLANSADASTLRHPHILAKVFRNDNSIPLISENQMDGNQRSSAILVKPETAQKIISAMMLTHQKPGTAFTACSDVWDAKSCQGDLGIAGKTGTPGDADERSLKQLQQNMKDRQTCFSRKQSGCDIRHPLPRPRYRWYGALFKQASSDKFDKVVVVLIQSNWRKSDGRFADDQNAATEIGLRAIKLLRHSEEER